MLNAQYSCAYRSCMSSGKGFIHDLLHFIMDIWSEELRPARMDDLLMSRETKEKILNWISSWESGNPKKKGLLLYGTPGVGKTSAAYVISKEKNWKILEVNSSEYRNEKFLNQTAGLYTVYMELDSFTDQYEKRTIDKMVLIDEADNIFERGTEGKETGGYVAIKETLRNTRVPVIITMNEYWDFYRRSTAKDIISMCEVVEFTMYKRKNDLDYKNAVARMADRIMDICSRSGLKVSRASIEGIIRNNFPDIRGAVNDAYSFALSSGESGESLRDRKSETFNVIREVLSGEDFDRNLRLIRESDMDKDTLLQWMNTNAPRECKTIKSLEMVENYLSIIDVISRSAARMRHYSLWRYVDELSAATFTMVDRHGGYTKYDFPTYLTAMSKSRKSRSAINRVCRAMEIAFHISHSDAIDNRPYFRELSKYAGGIENDFTILLNERCYDEIMHSNASEKRKKFEPLNRDDMNIYLSAD